jgi:hypothetical protein
MKIRIFSIAILLMTSVAFAAPTVEIKSSEQNTSRSDFAEDHLDLILKDKGEIRDTHYFYSSYGKADVKDAKGIYYVILRHGEGRGTHVRCEYITVFKVIKTLNQLVTFPLNGPAGKLSDWEYSYVLNKPRDGGLEFKLKLKISGDDAEVYPEDKVRTIKIE